MSTHHRHGRRDVGGAHRRSDTMCDRWSRYAQLMQEGEEKLLMRMLRPFDADLADGPMQMTIAHLAAE